MEVSENAKDIAELSYREASQELETIVRSLEGGELELEDALERFQRGTELLASLRERLAAAEQKVRVLTEERGESGPADTVSAPATAFMDE